MINKRGEIFLKNYVENINQSALNALCQNEIYQAQILFRQNVKDNPCFISFNNLGVFYAFEGLFKLDNSCRGAKKLGIKYLKNAETFQKSHLTLFALGTIFFEYEDYKEAEMYFKQTYELKHDYSSAYNLALSFYRQNLYVESMEYFKKALDVYDDFHHYDDSEHIETYVAYAFSLLQIDKNKCREALSYLFEDETEYMESDKFTLAYLCGEFEIAECLISPMLEHFSLTSKEMAMVFDCLFKFNKKDEAEKYLNNKIEILKEHDYHSQYDIRQLKKAFSQEEYRKELILSFRYIRPLIKECCYYGCKQHNPL